jgi:hypothetical protein
LDVLRRNVRDVLDMVRLLILACLMVVSICNPAYAAKVSAYPTATQPQTGTEKYLCLQGGADKQCTSALPGGYVNATAYGMKCDGTTDDTAALQAAINATLPASQGTLFLPAGMCIITSTIVITGPIKLTGAGGGASSAYAGTDLRWQGASTTTPMIDMQGVQDAVLEEFLIESTASFPLAIGIQSTTITGRQSTKNLYNRIFMSGTTSALGKGWAFVAGSGGDNNNDENTWLNCEVLNFSIAGWSFEHSQSQGHRIFASNYYGANVAGSSGVATNKGTGGQGGTFFFDGGFGCCVDTDFILGAASGPIIIENGNFESSTRFLTAGFSSNSWPVTIRDTRWAADALNADGIAIDVSNQGPLSLLGNRLGEYSGKALQIKLDDASSAGTGVAIGNTVYTNLAQPFVASNVLSSWFLIGNNINTGPATLLASTLALASLNANPSNPTGTTSTTGVMMGLGTSCTITPKATGKVVVDFHGYASNSVTSVLTKIKAVYGTGTAPANAAVLSGTAIDQQQSADVNLAVYDTGFKAGGIVTGLAINTAVWFDLQVATGTAADTASVSGINCSAHEF